MPWPAATLRVVERMRKQSQTLDGLVREGRIAIIGAMYDVGTGEIEFMAEGGMNHVISPTRFDHANEEDGRSSQQGPPPPGAKLAEE